MVTATSPAVHVPEVSGRPDVRDLFGVPIAAATMKDALDRVEAAIARHEPLQIGVVNAAKIVNMRRDPTLREDVLSSDVIYADGMAVVWASRLLGRPLPERIAGIDLMKNILARGAERHWRVFCLGATDEVLDQAVASMKASYPGVSIVGQQHGYFGAADEEQVARTIATTRPDVLFVAMTSPKKENFLARFKGLIDAPVCHGVGGSFDVLAGKVERAPEAWQRLGLEWLYRVKQEPRRLWRRYLVTNTLFCGMVVGQLLRRLWPAR
jgi:N-acetylglucosaminyldiphosphoundecaprenol N-acetyl-beta-D-mannosaminyltransferase